MSSCSGRGEIQVGGPPASQPSLLAIIATPDGVLQGPLLRLSVSQSHAMEFVQCASWIGGKGREGGWAGIGMKKIISQYKLNSTQVFSAVDGQELRGALKRLASPLFFSAGQ